MTAFIHGQHRTSIDIRAHAHFHRLGANATHLIELRCSTLAVLLRQSQEALAFVGHEPAASSRLATAPHHSSLGCVQPPDIG
jgi:hypothetical protein